MKACSNMALSCMSYTRILFLYLDDHFALMSKSRVSPTSSYKRKPVQLRKKVGTSVFGVSSVILAESKYKNTMKSLETSALD